MKKDLITIGYHKGEMDFGVSCLVGELTLEELKELREMIVVAIWCAEDMWRRNQESEAKKEVKKITRNRK